ncbi:peroxiredoxin family protein [Mucilaginibacter conchicola]|nr:TlpA disulfide reductase family protein [Mucilaginibacter conchicola]
MKKIFSLIITIICCSLWASAQQQKSGVVVRSAGPLENRKMIDSTGKVLEPEEWRELLSTGHYSTKPVIGTDTVKVIKLTDREYERAEATAPPPFAAAAFPIGAKMEMFTAKDINGKKIDPKALEGKTVVLDFWFIACPPCKAEIPELNKLAAAYSANPDVVFIAVCLDQRWDIKDFMKTKPFNFTQVANGREIAEGFNVTSYPTSVVLDTKGIIRYSSQGFGVGYARYMKEAVEDSVSGN